MKGVAISFIHVASLLIFTLASGHAGAQSLSIRGDLDLSVGNFKQNNRTRVISGSSASYYVDQADIGYAGLYAYTDQYSGGSIFKDYAGDTILYLGSAMNSHGKVGIGTTSPNGKMEILGDIVFHPVTSLYGTSGKAKLFSYTDSGLTFMCAMDSSGDVTPFSPHRFSLFQPDPDEALPWSYYSENRFVGKKINVDMAGAIRAVERLSGQKFIYYADLPASERIRIDDWKASETQRMLFDAKRKEIEKMPLVEIPFSEAWEQVDEVEKVKSVQTVTYYRINWDSMNVEPYEEKEIVEIANLTGRKIKQLKQGVIFDRKTGRFHRNRTLEDVTVDAASISNITLPEYVMRHVSVY